MEYQRDEHRIHLIVYHLVWCPKRRKPVLTGAVAQDCERLLREKCQEQGWKIIELSMQPEHIHLCIQVWPAISAAEVVKECKGLTAHALREKYPMLHKLPSLWTRSYFAATAGNVSSDTIKRYIAAQKGL